MFSSSMFSVGCGIIAEDVDGRLFRLTTRCFVDDFRPLWKEQTEMLRSSARRCINKMRLIFTHTYLLMVPARDKSHFPKPLRKYCWVHLPLFPRDRADRLLCEVLLPQRSRECLWTDCIVCLFVYRLKGIASEMQICFLLTVFHVRYHGEVFRSSYFIVVFIIHFPKQFVEFFVIPAFPQDFFRNSTRPMRIICFWRT